MNPQQPQPPSWARKFLAWYCRPELLEDLEGDFNEYFFRNLETKGVSYAKLTYIIDVMKFVRPYTVRKRARFQPAHQAGLLKIYSISAVRGFMKRKLSTAISLLSLIIGLSCFIIISLYVANELSFNKHYANHERIGRVSLTIVDKETKETVPLVWTNPQLPDELRESYPEIEAVTGVLKLDGKAVVKTKGSVFLEDNFVTADRHYSKVFKHRWLAGNPATALNEPGCIVLTRTLANRYFDEREALNKTLSVNDRDYHITGVIEDLPDNTDLRFNALLSLDSHFGDWCITYILFKSAKSFDNFQEKLDAHFDESLKPILAQTGNEGSYDLEPLTEIHLGDKKLFDSPKSNRTVLYVLFSIAVLILIVTVVNYLAIAFSIAAQKVADVRVRKVFGARQGQIWLQYTTQTFLLAFTGLLLSLLVVFYAVPQLRENDILPSSFPDQWINIKFFLAGIVIILILSVIAGGVTAVLVNRKVFTSGISGVLHARGTRPFYLAFVAVHLTIALSMVFSAKVVRNQVNELLNMNPGYNTKQILVIDIPGDTSVFPLLNSLKELYATQSFVSHVSLTGPYSTPTGDIGFDIFTVDEASKESWRTINYIKVDNDYFDLFNIGLKEGRHLNESSPYEVVVNEALVRNMGWQDPLGQYITNLEVVGVAENFHFYGLERKPEPLIFRLNNQFPEKMLIQLKNSSRRNLATIKDIWSARIKGHPFSYRFLDDYFEQHLEKEYAVKNLLMIFTFVSILLASIGIFGAVNIRMEQSMKETAIRKILGARLIELLSARCTEYGISIIFASLLALPLSIFVVTRWLQKFAYKTSIEGLCLESISIITALSMLAILYHAIRIAKINPLESIRNE